MTTEIISGCCLDHLPKMADNSIDAIVTDPPYEIGIVGTNWDNAGVAYAPGVWIECLRVLRPGGHLLAFGGTRTYHRLACAVEDAGFEIRDAVSWLYGSGFPKSHNISKALDKTGGDKGRKEANRIHKLHADALKETGLSTEQLAKELNVTTRLISYWKRCEASYLQPHHVKRLSELAGRELPAQKDIPQTPRREVGLHKNPPSDIGIPRAGGWQPVPGEERKMRTEPLSDEGRQWSGWGTALKPGMELIVLARKPISEKTVALNVKRWRTGAINIDDCRVPYGDEPNQTRKRFQSVQRRTHDKTCDDDNEILTRPGPDRGYTKAQARKLDAEKRTPPDEGQGRWPANVAHDGSDEVEAGMPVTKPGHSAYSEKFKQRDGIASPGGAENPNNQKGRNEGYGHLEGAGSASRYFYCAKTTRAEREAGLDQMKDDQTKRANSHPTVKPIELMRWLCRLITPPNGIVLDPFAGSGTTIIAAHLEGFDGIGIEQSEQFAEIANARLKYWRGDLV